MLAVCHIDGTARLQTVTANQEPKIFALLTEYERLSGIPLLCNTSANRAGRVPALWSDGSLYERQ